MSAAKPNVPVRERILDCAAELFYRDGIRATGIDRVIAEAGVAKMSLYNHFAGKDELVLAFLERRDEKWMNWLKERVEREPPTDKRLTAVFDALHEWFASKDFRGCAFINASVEYADEKSAVAGAALRHKARLRDFLELTARGARMRKPDELAWSLLLLIEGAIVTAQMQGHPAAAKRARKAAATLMGQHAY
jgi:AcrR family transcriptional regulator